MVVIVARINIEELKRPSSAARKEPIAILAKASGSVRKRIACIQAVNFEDGFIDP